MNNNILLESGTGELEVIEFMANNCRYAINVVKVKEIIEMPKETLTTLPDPKPEVAGLILCRDEILTLIDLKYILCKRNAGNLGSKVIIMLDFEKIVTDIAPGAGISEDRLVKVDYRDRSDIKLVLADDSALIRRLLKETLSKAGFKSMTVFNDGKQAFDYIVGLKDRRGEEFLEDVDILITDIEMPQLDGLTLTRKIKEDEVMKKLPVIIFSSLITEELRHKGESVKANAQLSKPEIEALVDVIDKLIEKNKIS